MPATPDHLPVQMVPDRHAVEAALADFYRVVNKTKVGAAPQIVRRFFPRNLEGLLADVQQKYRAQCESSEWEALYRACMHPPQPPPLPDTRHVAPPRRAAAQPTGTTKAPPVAAPVDNTPTPPPQPEVVHREPPASAACVGCARLQQALDAADAERASQKRTLDALAQKVRQLGQAEREAGVAKRSAERIFAEADAAQHAWKKREAKLTEALTAAKAKVAQLQSQQGAPPPDTATSPAAERQLREELAGKERLIADLRSQVVRLSAAGPPSHAPPGPGSEAADLREQLVQQIRETGDLRAQLAVQHAEHAAPALHDTPTAAPLSQENQALRSELEALQGQVAALRAAPLPEPASQQPQHGTAELQEEVQALRLSNEGLAHDAERLRRAASDAEQLARQEGARCEEMQGKVRQLIRDNEQVVQDNLQLREAADSTAREQRALEDLQTEQASVLRQGLEELNREKEQLGHRLAQLLQENGRLEADLQQLRTLEEEHSVLRASHSNLQTQYVEALTSKQEELSRMESSMHSARQSAEMQSQSLETDVGQLRARGEALQGTVQMLQRENIVLKDSLTSQDVLQSNVATLRRKVEALEGLNTQHQQSIASEREKCNFEASQKLQQLQKVEDFREKNTFLESRAANLQAKAQELRDMLDAQKRATGDAERQLQLEQLRSDELMKKSVTATELSVASSLCPEREDRAATDVLLLEGLPATAMLGSVSAASYAPSSTAAPEEEAAPEVVPLDVFDAMVQEKETEAGVLRAKLAALLGETALLQQQADEQRCEAQQREELLEGARSDARMLQHRLEEQRGDEQQRDGLLEEARGDARILQQQLEEMRDDAQQREELLEEARSDARLLQQQLDHLGTEVWVREEHFAVERRAREVVAAIAALSEEYVSEVHALAGVFETLVVADMAACVEAAREHQAQQRELRSRSPPPPPPPADAGAGASLCAVIRCVERVAARSQVTMQPTAFLTHGEQAAAAVMAIEQLPHAALRISIGSTPPPTDAVEQMCMVQRDVARLHALHCAEPDVPTGLKSPRPIRAGLPVLDMLLDVVHAVTTRVAAAEARAAALEGDAAARACPANSGYDHLLQLRDEAVAHASKCEAQTYESLDFERRAAVKLCEAAEEANVVSAAAAAAASQYLSLLYPALQPRVQFIT